MKTLILTCAAVAGLCAAAPASATTSIHHGRVMQISRALTYCVSHDMTSAGHAASLRSQLRSIQQLELRLRAGGYTRAENRQIDRALTRLEARVQVTCPLTAQ